MTCWPTPGMGNSLQVGRRLLPRVGRAAVAVLVLGIALAPRAVHGQAVIDNGLVQLGIQSHGGLVWDGTGLRFTPYGWDVLTPGVARDGWGVGISGGAFDQVFGAGLLGSTVNLVTGPTVATAQSALTTATLRFGETDLLRINHAFSPSAMSANLFEVRVTLTNLTSAWLGTGEHGIRYRRIMDWDGQANYEDLGVTVGRDEDDVAIPHVLGFANNGFVSPSPFSPLSAACNALVSVNSYVFGDPCDLGAAFDFGFGSLDAGASMGFSMFYGAASDQWTMFGALQSVGAAAYSMAWCSTCDNRDVSGEFGNVTYGFGFAPESVTVVPEPMTMLLLGTGLAGIGAAARRRRRRESLDAD
jgi:hypothetical protein